MSALHPGSGVIVFLSFTLFVLRSLIFRLLSVHHIIKVADDDVDDDDGARVQHQRGADEWSKLEPDAACARGPRTGSSKSVAQIASVGNSAALSA